MYNPKLQQKFTISEQQKSHTHQHAMQYKHNSLYTLGPEGRIDRRKMIYHNTPTKETKQANGKIKFNVEQQKWEFQVCGGRENTKQTKHNPTCNNQT